jgi:hypothetical protein
MVLLIHMLRLDHVISGFEAKAIQWFTILFLL